MGASNVATRWLRALTLALVVVIASAGGHAAADGATPPPMLLLPLFLLTAVAVSPFVNAPLAPVRVTVLLLGGQLVMHAALLLASGHQHVGNPLMGYAAPREHLVMLLAHLGAAAVIGLWLVVGERAARTALHLAARSWHDTVQAVLVALDLATCALVGRPTPVPVRIDSIDPPSRAWSGRQVTRRGPPRACR